MKAECEETKATQCAECERGLFTATKNHLNKCHVCTVCSSSKSHTELYMHEHTHTLSVLEGQTGLFFSSLAAFL